MRSEPKRSATIKYLNAKVSKYLRKCLSDPNMSLGDNVIDKSHGLLFIQHENQNDETYGCRASTRNVRQPQTLKSHRVTIPYILFESQSYNTLHFIRKKFLTSICFQKQSGRQIKPGLLYAFVNVHNVNANPSKTRNI